MFPVLICWAYDYDEWFCFYFLFLFKTKQQTVQRWKKNDEKCFCLVQCLERKINSVLLNLLCLDLNNSPSKLLQMLFGSCLEGDFETRMSNKLIGRKKEQQFFERQTTPPVGKVCKAIFRPTPGFKKKKRKKKKKRTFRSSGFLSEGDFDFCVRSILTAVGLTFKRSSIHE